MALFLAYFFEGPMIKTTRLIPYLIIALIISPFIIFRRQAEGLWARLGILAQGIYNVESLAAFIGQNDVEAVKEYLKAGMSPNEEWVGSPVFFSALENPFLPLFNALAEAGANFNLKDREGNTAWTYVINKGWKSQYCVEKILKHGGDVNLADRKGNTPLMMAVSVGMDLEPFLKAGANVNATNKEGQTALGVAVAMNDVRAIRQLLNAGADPNKERLQDHPSLSLVAQLAELEKMDPLSQTTYAMGVLDRALTGAHSYPPSSDQQLLVAMGPLAVPLLIQGFSQSDPMQQGFYLSMLSQIGPAAAPAGPVVVRAAREKKMHSMDLQQILPRIAPNDIPTIDALVEFLQTESDQNALWGVVHSLSEMGPHAQRAVPALERLKNASGFTESFRRTVQDAIAQIQTLISQ